MQERRALGAILFITLCGIIGGNAMDLDFPYFSSNLPDELFVPVQEYTPPTQSVQCPKKSKKRFTLEEDRKIVHLVHKFDTSSWSLISLHLPGRDARQCRDRWYHHLKTLWEESNPNNYPFEPPGYPSVDLVAVESQELPQ
ncbi:MAG: SANT/Myb domain-containing protein [Holosporales bacterium]|jgi:hypothetical protein|nr:SANT/Myb domain-containing protein [Holosporales bacterium]